jgi:hypothetical protein
MRKKWLGKHYKLIRRSTELLEYQGSSHSRYHKAIDQSNNREEKDEGTVHTDCTLMMMLFDISH